MNRNKPQFADYMVLLFYCSNLSSNVELLTPHSQLLTPHSSRLTIYSVGHLESPQA